MNITKSNNRFLYLNGEMNDEMINSLLNFYNSISSETNEAMIYLNSSGGLYCSMQIMLDIINHSKVKITLVAVEHIISCAFYYFILQNVIKF